MHPVTRPVIAAIFLACASLSQAAADFSACPQFFANAQPPVVAAHPTNRALCYDAFAILHSGESKTAVYVAQKLNRTSVADADEKRTNKFFADARLRSAERATLEDYKGSGWSRGHLAPAGDMPTAQAMAQSFSLANMVPQAAKHNGGAWAHSVESATRKYAARDRQRLRHHRPGVRTQHQAKPGHWSWSGACPEIFIQTGVRPGQKQGVGTLASQ